MPSSPSRPALPGELCKPGVKINACVCRCSAQRPAGASCWALEGPPTLEPKNSPDQKYSGKRGGNNRQSAFPFGFDIREILVHYFHYPQCTKKQVIRQSNVLVCPQFLKRFVVHDPLAVICHNGSAFTRRSSAPLFLFQRILNETRSRSLDCAPRMVGAAHGDLCAVATAWRTSIPNFGQGVLLGCHQNHATLQRRIYVITAWSIGKPSASNSKGGQMGCYGSRLWFPD